MDYLVVLITLVIATEHQGSFLAVYFPRSDQVDSCDNLFDTIYIIKTVAKSKNVGVLVSFSAYSILKNITLNNIICSAKT